MPGDAAAPAASQAQAPIEHRTHPGRRSRAAPRLSPRRASWRDEAKPETATSESGARRTSGVIQGLRRGTELCRYLWGGTRSPGQVVAQPSEAAGSIWRFSREERSAWWENQPYQPVPTPPAAAGAENVPWLIKTPTGDARGAREAHRPLRGDGSSPTRGGARAASTPHP